MGRAEERRAQKRGGSAPRSARGKKPKKAGIRRFFTWKKLLAYFFGLIALGVGAFVALYMYVDVPKDGKYAARAQATVYKLDDGTVIKRDGAFNREEVPFQKIPKTVQNAVVAAENKDFWDDSGVDLQGTARGILNTVMGRGKQGGSTITQQYVKNYYLDQRQTVSRKVTELIISLKLKNEKSKEDILAGYLNTSYFGRNAYGIQAASHAYFNKDVDKLSTQEAAYLAALLQAPSQYDVVTGTDTGKRMAKERWAYVLDKEVEKGWLTKAERTKMSFPKVGKVKPDTSFKKQYGYFYDLAKVQAEEAIKQSGGNIGAGGYTITLSIDAKRQAALEKAVDDQLWSKLDPSVRKIDKAVQPGAVSVDPKTGKIVAMYGGKKYLEHQINNASREDYTPGSTFKPFIYASALANGAKTQDGKPINANTIYNGDNEHVIQGPGADGYAPENEDQHSYGPVTVEVGMEKSINPVFAQMAVDVGLEKVKDTAVGLGMNPKVKDFVTKPAMALGAMGQSPLHMAGAYATLNNHGQKVEPSIIKSISRGGSDISLPKSSGGEKVISRDAADGVTAVLKSVVESDDGTANKFRSDRYQVAGKTGTAEKDRAAWFTAYTPDLTTVVAVYGEGDGGKQEPLYGAGGLPRVNGSGYPAEIWAAYTDAALGDDATAKFDLETDNGAATQAPPPPTTTAPPVTQAPTTPPATPSKPPTTPPATTKPPTTKAPETTPPTHHTKPPKPPKPPTDPPTGNTGKPNPPGDNGGPGGDDGLHLNGLSPSPSS
ncbi:transglycosylase domain-containing protein [Streptomyces luteireticuli]|uniref:transglycosylase domain-containing protein n=1 Tax=Streptomyces luteireticuli TaxID=173858 RepID=UPI0035564604